MTPKTWIVLIFAALTATCGAAFAWAQDQSSQEAVNGLEQALSGSDSSDGAASAKPFTAQVTIDSRVPIAYGDDASISVWITPLVDLDMDYVRLHPKGDLASIYMSAQEEPSIDPKELPTLVAGTKCRVGVQGYRKGEAFLAICELTSLHKGFLHWVGHVAFMDSGRQQLAVEVGLQRGGVGTATYYDFVTADFISPKLAVIFGGFLGAFVYSLITYCVTPAGRVPLVASWRQFWVDGWGRLPQVIVTTVHVLWEAGRRSLLGGVTAMVLIILAKSSQGLEPPISLSIQDVWGGMLIGLLSIHLAKWVIQKVDSMFEDVEAPGTGNQKGDGDVG